MSLFLYCCRAAALVPVSLPKEADSAPGPTLVMLVILWGLVDVHRAGWKAPSTLLGVKTRSQLAGLWEALGYHSDFYASHKHTFAEVKPSFYKE